MGARTKAGPRKREHEALNASRGTTIATAGEVFPDGGMIELVRDAAEPERAALLLWDGAKETIGPLVEHKGRFYEPLPINRSLLRQLTLPTYSRPHGSARALLWEGCKLVKDFVGLPEKLVGLVGRFALVSSIVGAVQVAPALAITGPDVSRGNRLLQLLRCLCRHSLPMTGVTPAELCSLPSGVGFTLLVSQSTISGKLHRLLDDASRRDQKILFRGGLLDLYGAQVLHSESVLAGESGPFRSIEIPMIPTSEQLPTFDESVQHRIAADFQPKSLGYRFANYGKASSVRFDASSLTHSIRELAHSLAAATPDDADLQAEVVELLREEDIELRSAKWVDLSTIVIEAICAACYESKGGFKYVGDLAEMGQEIWTRRDENTDIDPGAFGKVRKLLGFVVEPRDAKGVKLRLSEENCRLAHQLRRDLGLPEAEVGGTVQTARSRKEK